MKKNKRRYNKQLIIVYTIIIINIMLTTYCNYKTTCAINELKDVVDYINSQLQNEEVSRDW